MRTYVVRKWPLRGRSRFVCWNITRVSLWLLCNVHFVQGTHRTIATWPRWPKGTYHCSNEEYRCIHIDACVARTSISYRCVPCHPWCTHRISLVVKKKLFSIFLWLCTIPLRKVLWFSCYKCNHGENYETPCIIGYKFRQCIACMQSAANTVYRAELTQHYGKSCNDYLQYITLNTEVNVSPASKHNTTQHIISSSQPT